MKRNAAFPLLAMLCFAAAACSDSGSARRAADRPLVLWEKDQLDLACPENIWSGFTYGGGRLLAAQQEPVLFFHLSAVPREKRLTVVYSKNSRGRAVLKVNGETALFLDPTAVFRQMRRKIDNLHTGLNFISFSGPVEGLILRGIHFQRRQKEEGELRRGESLRLALEAGTLRLSFRGSARFQTRVTFVSSRGDVQDTVEKAMTSGFPFFQRELRIEAHHSFLVQVTCTAGSLHLAGLDFAPAPAAAAASAWKRKKLSDVFIFLWDACQAGHLGLYGYDRPTAPFLSDFARDALVFRSAYANASYTAASVSSLFTGLYPLGHGRLAIDSKLPPELPTLGSFFKERGYATALFTTNANVSYSSGLGKGIDHFARLLDVYVKNESHRVVRDFSVWVAGKPGPRFAYLHFMEPHFPLIPPPPFRNQYKRKIRPKEQTVIRHLNEKEVFTPEEVQDAVDDYDSAINYVDSLFRAAVEELKSRGIYEESLIILLADHGEACYENGAWGHDNNILPETTRIPLLIKFPRSFGLAGEVRETAQIIDLFPTLHYLLTGSGGDFDSPAGLPAPGAKEGERPIYIQGFPDQGFYALQWGKWYYWLGQKSFQQGLFELQDNALPLPAGSEEEIRSFLRGRLLQWLRDLQRRSRQPLKFDMKSLSREEIDNLKTLGYL